MIVPRKSGRENRARAYDVEKRYEAAATEIEKIVVIRTYIDELLADDPNLRRLRREVEATMGVVPAALDYGMLLIQYAQLDPEQRETRLAAAERVLVSIQAAAEGTPSFMIALGKVHCWLGDIEAGREQFERLLENDRSAANLVEVASALRDVGLYDDARPLATEAFETAVDPGMKTSAATTAALLADTPDERVEWMRKVDDSSPIFQAQLESALARQALSKGDREGAILHSTRQIEILETFPEDGMTLNNRATAYVTRYQITQAPEDFERGSALFERAAQMRPASSIIAANAGYSFLLVAVAGVVGTKIDFAAAEITPDLAVLEMLYSNRTERDRVGRQLAKLPATGKARASLERARVLSPNDLNNPLTLLRLYQLLGDEEALARLVGNLEATAPDLSAGARSHEDYVTGKHDESNKTGIDATIATAREGLAGLDPRKQSLEYAAQANTLGAALMTKDSLDGEGLDEAIEVFETSRKYVPNASEPILVRALLRRAIATVSASDPGVAQLAKDFSRRMGTLSLASYLMQSAATRDLLLADRDAARALDLHHAAAKRYSDRPEAWDWALARTDDEREQATQRLGNAPISELTSRLTYTLNHYHSGSVYERVLRLRVRGDAAGAAEVLKQAERDQVPMPPI